MRINVEYSTQHWIFPIITIGILVILGVLLIALEGRARIKAGKGFFVKPGRFFVEHYDKFKFWGTIALMVVYFFLLDKLGFTFWSIICLFLFNTLFANKAQLKNPRYHITSLIISVVAASQPCSKQSSRKGQSVIPAMGAKRISVMPASPWERLRCGRQFQQRAGV